MRSFLKIKASRNDEITLSSTDVGKSYPIRDFLTSNANREIRVLAKMSDLAVFTADDITSYVD